MNSARDRSADETPVNSEALYDFLFCLAQSVLERESGDSFRAEITQLGASAAALRAFPIGSPESRSLGCILAAASRVSAEVTP